MGSLNSELKRIKEAKLKAVEISQKINREMIKNEALVNMQLKEAKEIYEHYVSKEQQNEYEGKKENSKKKKR